MDNKIIEKLKKERVKMRPKWQFILGTLFFGLAVFITSLLCLFLCSFLLFSFRPFPWLIFFSLIIFVVLLEYLFSKHSIAYKRPIIYSLIILIFLLFLLGLAVNRIRFHEMMEKRNLPGIHRIYKRYPMAPPLNEIKRMRRL
jgi:hypothetical protein